MIDISKNIIGSLLSAIVIAILFSIWNDFFYKKDRLTGYWQAEFRVLETSYSKYEGMKTYSDYLINQENGHITGTAEKMKENSKLGIIEYIGKDRTLSTFSGGISYRFFSNNIVDIHQTQLGTERKSSSIIKLKLISEYELRGDFVSTVANSSGEVVFKRVK